MNTCLCKCPCLLWCHAGVYTEQMKSSHSNFCLFLLYCTFSHFRRVSHFPPRSYKGLASVCSGSSRLLLTKADGRFPQNPFLWPGLARETRRAYWGTCRHTTPASERSPRAREPRQDLPAHEGSELLETISHLAESYFDNLQLYPLFLPS